MRFTSRSTLRETPSTRYQIVPSCFHASSTSRLLPSLNTIRLPTISPVGGAASSVAGVETDEAGFLREVRRWPNESKLQPSRITTVTTNNENRIIEYSQPKRLDVTLPRSGSVSFCLRNFGNRVPCQNNLPKLRRSARRRFPTDGLRVYTRRTYDSKDLAARNTS